MKTPAIAVSNPHTFYRDGWLYYTKNMYTYPYIYMAWKICYCFATIRKCHIQSFFYVQILLFSSFSSPQSTQRLWSSWKLQIFFFMIFNGILCCIKSWMHVDDIKFFIQTYSKCCKNVKQSNLKIQIFFLFRFFEYILMIFIFLQGIWIEHLCTMNKGSAFDFFFFLFEDNFWLDFKYWSFMYIHCLDIFRKKSVCDIKNISSIYMHV